MRLDLYKNVNTKQILDAIGLKEEYIPRLRGVGIDDGKILIHTRTGGGNRDSYDSVETAINGEYGIESRIADYKNPETDWLKDKPQEERDASIKEYEERKQVILATKAYTNEYLTSNEFYLSDEDDDFDCTYANFWFRIPDELNAELQALENKEAKAILGDAPTAIGLMFGDKKAIEQVNKNLEALP